MRNIIAAIIAAAVTLAALATAPGRLRANYGPQISRPSRTDQRVFLEHADVLHKESLDSFMIVAGNVKFRKGPMIMTCDSAHYYPDTESFDAFGRIKMQQGDTLFIFADELNYRGPQQTCYLYSMGHNKVRMINRDVTLETYIFVYDLAINLGYYTTGGELYDRHNRLTSVEGEYDPSRKEANFYTDVKLHSRSNTDTLSIFTDTLFYSTLSHIAELTSPSLVVNRRGIIDTRNGVYNTALDTAALYDRSHITTPEGRLLVADTIYYRRKEGIGECFGNLFMSDSARQACLSADYGFFNQMTDSAFATGHLLIKEYSKEDTLYVHGGQLNARRILSHVSIPAVEGDSASGTAPGAAFTRTDTSNVADIWPRVRFYRSDFQGVCDSLHVSSADTAMRMYKHPVVWSGDRQIHGNIIEVQMNDSTVRQALLPEYGFITQRLADEYYNQISGKEIRAGFDRGELQSLDISGNVELIMFPEEADSTINKLVKAESSFLSATFKGRTAERIKMWPETPGSVTPLFLVRRSMLFLPRFKRFDGIRPLSPADVTVIPAAMDALMGSGAAIEAGSLSSSDTDN